jgi:DNA-binding transcriptional LysR family regulator
MELYHLRSFVAVAEEGNLSRAATRLYLSQPALSAHIKALEDELGVALFLRTPKGMTLTDDGAALKASAEKVLGCAGRMAEEARARRTALSGVARIGLNTDPAALRVGMLVNTLVARQPDLEIHFVYRNSGQLLEDLRRDALDGTFVYGELGGPDVAALDLGPARVRVAGPPAWRPRLERASLRELAAMPWIDVPEYCPFHAMLTSLLGELGIPMPLLGVADNEYVLLAMAAAGQGLCLTCEPHGLEAAARGEVFLWPGEAFTLPAFFAYRRERAGDRLVRVLLDAVREVFADRSEAEKKPCPGKPGQGARKPAALA